MVEPQHDIDSPDKHTQSHKPRPKRDSYSHTYDEQRRCFLYDVTINHYKIKDAAIKYAINYSTAKTILRVYKDEGRIDKKKRKKESINEFVKPDPYGMCLAQESVANQQTSQNSSIDSFESINSLGSFGQEIRRVRTLPIPTNLFYLGMMHNPVETQIEQVDVTNAVPCSLKSEFWLDALKRADTLGKNNK